MRELVVKNGAAHQCLLQPPSSLPCSPTAITKTPSTTVLRQDAFVFIKTKHIVIFRGGGGVEGMTLNQVFRHQIFQEVS